MEEDFYNYLRESNSIGKFHYGDKSKVMINKIPYNSKIDILYSLDSYSGELFDLHSPFKYAGIYDKEKDTWYCESYWGLTGQKSIMGNFLHEVDREIRLRFNLGRNLKPRKIEKHYLKAIKDGIKEYQIEEQKLKQPKIEFNLSQLSTIRDDAAGTRDSLLTEEELQAEQEEKEQLEEAIVDTEQEDYGLSSEEMSTIILLLKGKDINKYLKEHHLMAAVIIDNINEKLFDEFGDNVIEFINDIPTVIEDYQEDLEDMFLKGTN